MQRLTYHCGTDTFTLRTTDQCGDEHVELFTVPAGAVTFWVAGVECVGLRRLCRAAVFSRARVDASVAA